MDTIVLDAPPADVAGVTSTPADVNVVVSAAASVPASLPVSVFLMLFNASANGLLIAAVYIGWRKNMLAVGYSVIFQSCVIRKCSIRSIRSAN